VADAIVAAEGVGLEFGLQVDELACRPSDVQRTFAAQDRDTSRVIAAIFQAGEPVQQYRHDIPVPHVTDNPTHQIATIGR